jgi:hypothetical protein
LIGVSRSCGFADRTISLLDFVAVWARTEDHGTERLRPRATANLAVSVRNPRLERYLRSGEFSGGFFIVVSSAVVGCKRVSTCDAWFGSAPKRVSAQDEI